MCSASTATIKYSEVTSAIRIKDAQRKSFAKDSTNEVYVVQSSTDRSNSLVKVLPNCRITSKVGASLGTIEFATITRNSDTSKPIVTHSKPRMIKLSEIIRRMVDLRRSITSTHRLK